MADEPTATATPAPPSAPPEATAPEAGAPPAEGAQPEAAASEGTESQQQAEDDIWARLSGVDPDEIIRKDPRLQGKLGALAQKQAAQLAQQQMAAFKAEQKARSAALRAAREEAQLEKLAREKPDQFAETWRAKQDERKYQQGEVRKFQQWRQETGSRIQNELLNTIANPEILERLGVTHAEALEKYNPLKRASWSEFVRDLLDAGISAQSTKQAKELAKELAEAERRDGQAERMRTEGAEPVDLGLGGSPVGAITLTRLSAMDSDQRREYIKNNPAAYNQLLAKAQ